MKKITQTCVMAILCLHLTNLFAQNNSTITGTVRNTAGQPLANATVAILQTNRGTITNAKGIFTFSDLSPGSRLRISLIGYAAQTITVENKGALVITLNEATNELDRVVVQGYGITSDRMRTGNIGKLTAKDIEKQPVLNVLDALQGRIPGVVVTHNNGYASSTIKVEIRGRNTIDPNQTADPLYIVDGVPLTVMDLYPTQTSYNNGGQGAIQSGILSPASGQSPLLSINPNDIESLEVLKDADATAIYGSRGANGVILITTKTGKPGKINVEAGLSTGYSSIIRYNHLLNTQQYVMMRREALTNDGLQLNDQTAPDLVVWDSTRYTDWQRFLWDNAGQYTNANATISGGNRQSSFRISANYSSRSEITTVSGYNRRGGLSFNVNQRTANERLNLSLTGMFSATGISLVNNPTILNTPPNAPAVWDANGNLNYAGWEPLEGRFFFDYLLTSYTSATDFLNSNFTLSYTIAQGLLFKTNLGFGATNARQEGKVPAAAFNPSQNKLGNARIGYSTARNLISEPQLNYLRYSKYGKIEIMAGASWQVNNTSGASLIGNNIPNDALLNNLASAGRPVINNRSAAYKYLAFFGRINYQLKDRYIVNLNGRRDGTSRFGPGRQFGNFASAGVAWIFSETRMIKENLPVLDFGNLRISYGTTGNDRIGEYQYQSAWSFSGEGNYNGIPLLFSERHYDSTIQWQVNKKLELGANFHLFKQRLELEAVWYRNRCNNQLIGMPLPVYSGFSSVLTNRPANVQNSGWEFVLKGTILKQKSLKLDSRFNIAFNRNKLISYPDFESSPYSNTLVIGMPLTVKRVLHFTGIDPQTGVYTFEDKNGNGKIDVDQSLKIKDDAYWINLASKYEGGWSYTLKYKKWLLDIFFFFRQQSGQKPLASFSGVPGTMGTQPVDVLRRWQSPGDITDIARFTTRITQESINYNQSDGLVTDASFARLQNVQLSYQFPEKISGKIGVRNLSIYLRAQNLMVVTSYRGADPEIQSINSMPMSRTITGGLSLQF